MLCLHLDKLRHRDAAPKISVVEADALSLPFPANTFDALANAFGLSCVLVIWKVRRGV